MRKSHAAVDLIGSHDVSAGLQRLSTEMATLRLMERRHLYYSGNVQGVGFRYTVQRLVSARGIVGFVRNLPDGRVELVIEGSPTELDHLQASIREHFAENIRDVNLAADSNSEPLSGFQIRR